jgi:hypothetical protein
MKKKIFRKRSKIMSGYNKSTRLKKSVGLANGVQRWI